MSVVRSQGQAGISANVLVVKYFNADTIISSIGNKATSEKRVKIKLQVKENVTK